MTIAGDMLRFGAVGTVGFVVDAGLLWLLVSNGVDPILARVTSFPLAVLATWWLNRSWTFARADKTRPHRQFNRYFAVQLLGAFANFIAYAIVLAMIVPTPINAVVALAVGSFLGMFINFFGSRQLIFHEVGASSAEHQR